MDMNKKSELSFSADNCENEKCEGGTAKRGLFSVSPTSQVRFAPGNLAEEGRSFVVHQWEYGGYFGWGTGNNPNNTSKDWRDYPSFYDWGKHIEGSWRTLTIDEWRYLLTNRTHAISKYGSGTVNGVHGLILLPDYWLLPTGCMFNAGMNGWEGNIYTLTQWQQMEEACAVFLPAAGGRWGTHVDHMYIYGDYWSSTPCSGYYAYHISSLAYKLEAVNSRNRVCGRAVRLVRLDD